VVEEGLELDQLLEAVAQRLVAVQVPAAYPPVASGAGDEAVELPSGSASAAAGGMAGVRWHEREATAVGSKSDLEVDPQVAGQEAQRHHDHQQQQQQQEEEEEDSTADAEVDTAAEAAAGGGAGDSQLRRSLRAIIGSDDRRPCPSAWPYSVVGQLDVTDSVQSEICTGALIGPDKVLTAAHCVWNFRDNTFVNKVAFAPGRYQDGCKVVSPHGIIPWKHVTILEVFSDEYVPDVAVITLAVPIGLKVGWLGLKTACAGAGGGGGSGANTTGATGASSRAKVTLQLTAAGYPQDRQQSKCLTSSCSVAFPDCSATTVEHSCDTEPGQSGSPMWDAAGYIRAVHTSGDIFSAGPQLTNNGAPLSQFVFDNIVQW
jgi:V8-like Glu-specific endopeptidase